MWLTSEKFTLLISEFTLFRHEWGWPDSCQNNWRVRKPAHWLSWSVGERGWRGVLTVSWRCYLTSDAWAVELCVLVLTGRCLLALPCLCSIMNIAFLSSQSDHGRTKTTAITVVFMGLCLRGHSFSRVPFSAHVCVPNLRNDWVLYTSSGSTRKNCQTWFRVSTDWRLLSLLVRLVKMYWPWCINQNTLKQHCCRRSWVTVLYTHVERCHSWWVERCHSRWEHATERDLRWIFFQSFLQLVFLTRLRTLWVVCHADCLMPWRPKPYKCLDFLGHQKCCQCQTFHGDSNFYWALPKLPFSTLQVHSDMKYVTATIKR